MFHGAWMFTRFAETDVIFRNPSAVNDPQVVEEAFNHGDGSFYRGDAQRDDLAGARSRTSACATW